jgi:hypothetical protein
MLSKPKATAVDPALNPILVAAALKGLEKQQKGMPAVDVGAHHVDARILLVVRGGLNKAADSEVNEPISIPWQRVLMQILKRAKIGRDESRRLVAQALGIAWQSQDGENDDQPTKDRLLDVDQAVTEFKMVQAEALGKKKRAGALTFTGTVEASLVD